MTRRAAVQLSPHSVGFVSTRAVEFSVESAQAPRPHRQGLLSRQFVGDPTEWMGLARDRWLDSRLPLHRRRRWVGCAERLDSDRGGGAAR